MVAGIGIASILFFIMPNNYFNFKQFTIYQENCAMKVTTEGCLFGAWFAAKCTAPGSILDIGSGTGLLMCMMAQVAECPIHGIEIDPAAFAQCRGNLAASPWHERLTVFEGDIRSFEMPRRYDLILSNPPFHQKSLLSSDHRVNLARHSDSLSEAALLESIIRNLDPRGSFGVLLPCHRSDSFELAAREKGFLLMGKLQVRQTPAHDFFRTILHMGLGPTGSAVIEEMTIRGADGTYSQDFSRLLAPYYL
jgi:tRNA1Val (adenine37-N6)-methyltransferase